MTLKLGALPPDPSKPRLKLKTLLTAEAPTYPENRDYISRVSKFPMYLNDKIGSCTIATVGHKVQIFTTYGQGQTVTISDSDVLKAYRDVSGYDPATGANDNGAVIQSVLNYWRKNGVAGHKILAFAEVDFRDLNEVRAALNLFGTIYLGIDFPESGFAQMDAGKPWDVVPGARSAGGHAINTAWYDVSDGMWKVVTWGRVVPMTQAFWDKYVFEAWVVITPEWFNAAGQSPTGIDQSALGQAFTNLTGEANPFPTPPVPVPPAPVPLTPDEVFIKQAKEWLANTPFFYKGFQKKLQAWLNSK